ncbi:N-6 DNA Methylase [Leptospira weilii serovar Ranarum str. ICFT]|uniref:site-specific DNA-methyltransferase (adenine-specific) n=1 Tax=Leptospira weilii serovar Ranarum str. ICFT TaxID=1218598 RepID=N1WKK9_9LEPT|nr:N-6 DNA methylase [Leptospira weilii]EMY77887.1 N-6 DNA Methylase [Leptospira weilii serovar Ranarum str. ICFT]
MSAKASLTLLVKILQEDRFFDKSGQKIDFLKYVTLRDFERKTKGDEDTVVTPLLLKILDFLGYKSGVNIIQQDFKGGDKPDFRTFKTNLFILDAKSTGVTIEPTSSNTSETPSTQISRYLRTFEGYKYGILFNLKKFEFYVKQYDENGNLQIQHVQDKSIDLVELYNTAKDSVFTGDVFDNFIWFYETFQFREISKDSYINEIKNREKIDLIKPDKDLLKATIYNSLYSIRNDIENQISNLAKDSYEFEQLEFELEKIKYELKIRDEDEKERILLEEFVKQASYVLLIKLILIRILEDNDLISRSLYNGGFKIKTEPPFSYTLKKILTDAKIDASEFIPSFFEESVYNFYIENENTFIEILFELSKVNFSEIDFDLIGDLYEHYLNLEERKEKGQYYTPHYIVEFILNRVGFSSRNFENINNKSLLDPSCGSGGFLVEAARRIRKVSLNREGEAKINIANNLYGVELTAFAAFLCEVNLIVQILPLIKQLPQTAQKKIHSLNVYIKDSLMQIYNHLESNGETLRSTNLHVTASPKEKKFIQLVNKNDFDIIVGNPPYVGESGHKEIFKPLQEHPYWKKFYQGKSDYLYYFIILGISKLRDGGKFSFITTQYWLTADGGSNLRNYILNTCKILEIIDFKGIKLFPEAKGQENIVFVLERCEDENERSNNRIKIIQFNKDWVLDPTETLTTKKTVITNYDRWQMLLLNKEQFDLFSDPEKNSFSLGNFSRNEIADVYNSAIGQGELDDKAWYIYKKTKDEIQLSDNIVELEKLCNVNQGVVPGPVDTRKIFSKLSKASIDKYHITENEGVFILSKDILESKKIEKDLIFPFYKNSNIKTSFIKFSTDDYILYTPNIDSLENFPAFKDHISRYKDYLITRREVENDRIRWFDLWWPREKSLFENEKIMISYRTKRNSFAYTNLPFYSATDTYYINSKSGTKESLKYIFGILISDNVLNWLKSGNCKVKGDALELFTTSVSKIPIPLVDFTNERSTAIYYFLAGEYSLTELNSNHKLNENSNTYIKQLGLIDLIIDWTKILYDLLDMGLLFDIENRNANSIEYNYQLIAQSLSSKIETKTLETLTIFNDHLNNEELVKESYIFFKDTTKDFVIKEVIDLDGTGFSLIEPDNQLKKYGYRHSIRLRLKNKSIKTMEIKGAKLAEFISRELKNILNNNKEVDWKIFKNIYALHQQLLKTIEESIKKVTILLSPHDKIEPKIIENIISKLDINEVKKIGNLNLCYEILNRLTSELYSSKNR